MTHDFNTLKFNTEALKPSKIDMILRNHVHTPSKHNARICKVCGKTMAISVNKTLGCEAAKILAEQLELMKTIGAKTLLTCEQKQAKKYFDLIPYLNNMSTLYDILIDSMYEMEEE